MEKTTEATAVMVVTPEQAMTKEVTAIEARAQSAVVQNDIDYQKAAGWLENIKSQQKRVKEFFEPMRKAAKETYDSVLSRKKEMLDPLDNAEKILKRKMTVYYEEQEKLRLTKEEELRQQAQAEADRAFEEAVDAESCGDMVAAEFAMADAEILENAAVGIGQLQAPKAKNVSHSKTWEITGINESEVPISINGAIIRPVNEKAVLALIKASKGKIKIPGVDYKETVTISVRSK